MIESTSIYFSIMWILRDLAWWPKYMEESLKGCIFIIRVKYKFLLQWIQHEYIIG